MIVKKPLRIVARAFAPRWLRVMVGTMGVNLPPTKHTVVRDYFLGFWEVLPVQSVTSSSLNSSHLVIILTHEDETGIAIKGIHSEIILSIILEFFLRIGAEICMMLRLNLCL